jgi:CheY-like chemotaxis protein
MANTKILVVEDERIVATDIKKTLKTLGYPAPATASSGKEAIKKATEYHPDLVLIDIQLKGEMNGLKAAQQIHDHFDIPVVYIMDDADEETLRDERVIEPFYYILRPFEENSLQIGIEKALYKHKMGKLWKTFNHQSIREEARWR